MACWSGSILETNFSVTGLEKLEFITLARNSINMLCGTIQSKQRVFTSVHSYTYSDASAFYTINIAEILHLWNL